MVDMDTRTITDEVMNEQGNKSETIVLLLCMMVLYWATLKM